VAEKSNAQQLQVAAQCFVIGYVAGLRSMSAPAAMMNYLVEGRSEQPLPDFLKRRVNDKTRQNLYYAALGEMTVEKISALPPRTHQPGMGIRCTSGTACGALMAYTKSASPLYGAALGFAGAFVASHMGYAARQWISDNLHIHISLLGIPEDVLTAALGIVVTAQ